MTRRAAVVLAGFVAALAALAGIDARATYGARTTADEPQYLLTAESLLDDGDLDIADEIRRRAYVPYHEVTIDRQTTVRADGSEISPHDPLLPAVLAVPYAVGGWVASKLALAVIAGLTAAATAAVAIRRFAVTPATAAVTTGAAFVGIPLSAYGTQVYPELPAALLVLVGVGAATRPELRRREIATAAATVLLLPWLAVKYAPVAAVVAATLLVRVRGRDRLAVTAVLAAGGGAFLLLHRWWYGGWTAYAAGDHFESSGEFGVVGTEVDLVGRSRRLVGLLVDAEFGIAAWSPFWLLLPIALAALARRRGAASVVWIAVVAAGWSTATFVALTMHGWWVPGRQLVAVLPIAVVVIAAEADRRRWMVVTAATLGVLGAVNWLWLAVEASTGRRTLVVDFMATGAWPYRAIRPLLPAGIAPTATDTALLAAWAVATLAAVAATAGRAPSTARPVSRRSPARRRDGRRRSPASPAAGRR